MHGWLPSAVFEDKSLADNVVVAVEKQIHYGDQEHGNVVELEDVTPAQTKTAVWSQAHACSSDANLSFW